jgi:predicted PurR-regulated permease PerM
MQEPAVPTTRRITETRSVYMRTSPSNYAQVVIAIGVALTLCYVARLVLTTLLVSVLVAFLLAPVRDFLQNLRLPRAVSSLVAVLLLIAVLYGAVYVSYSQAVSFMLNLPKYSNHIRAQLMDFRRQAESFQKTTESVLADENPEPQHAVAIAPAPQSTWERLAESLGSVTQVLLAVSFIPFLVYFMLTWQSHVRSSTVMLFRLENRHAAYVTLGMIAKMLRGFLVGNMIIGLLLSVASTLIFWMAGLPFFYFIGPISGFLSLAPYAGAVLALGPPLVVGLGQISMGTGVIVAIWILLLHVIALNVLYPKLLGNRLQLNPLAVTVALLFWGWLWGGMGLVLAIPITGAMKIVFDHVEQLRPWGVWLGQ